MAFTDSILVRLGLDNTGFNRGLVGAQQSASKFTSFFKSAFGVGIGISTIGLVGKKITELADTITTLKNTTGLAVGTIQTLQEAVIAAGGKASEANVSMEKFAIAVGNARSGNEEAKRTFQTLGIELVDTAGMVKRNEVVLLELADALAKIKDPSERSRIAVKMFGETGLEMAVALSKGSAEILRFRQELEKSGRIMTEGELSQVDKIDKGAKAALDTLIKFGARRIAQAGQLFRIVGTGVKSIFSGAKGEELGAQLDKILFGDQVLEGLKQRQVDHEKSKVELMKEQLALQNKMAIIAERRMKAELDVQNAQMTLAKAQGDRGRFGSLEDIANADFSKGATPQAMMQKREARRAMALDALNKSLTQAGLGDSTRAIQARSLSDQIRSTLTLATEEVREPLLKEQMALFKAQLEVQKAIQENTAMPPTVFTDSTEP